MENAEIESGVPLPVKPKWASVLTQMKKEDSFLVTLEENLFAIYKEAEALELRITHRQISPRDIRVWRTH